MDGRPNMNKYDKMIALNKETSKVKVELARKTILEMMEDGVKVTVPKLMAKTGLSRGFFYKNPIIRKMLNEVQQQQAGMTDPRRRILDMAMDNEIVMLHEQIRALQRENETLKSENRKLQQSVERRTVNQFRNL